MKELLMQLLFLLIFLSTDVWAESYRMRSHGDTMHSSPEDEVSTVGPARGRRDPALLSRIVNQENRGKNVTTENNSIKETAKRTKMTAQECSILLLILAQQMELSGNKTVHKQGEYSVIDSETADLSRSLGIDLRNQEKTIASKKKELNDLSPDGTDISELIATYIERNKEFAQLSMPSSSQDGYVIDHEAFGKKCFTEKGGGGWKAWREKFPNAYGSEKVSIPAYDKKTGLVLVYRSITLGSLAGSGWAILYKLHNGKIKELKKLRLWES